MILKERIFRMTRKHTAEEVYTVDDYVLQRAGDCDEV